MNRSLCSRQIFARQHAGGGKRDKVIEPNGFTGDQLVDRETKAAGTPSATCSAAAYERRVVLCYPSSDSDGCARWVQKSHMPFVYLEAFFQFVQRPVSTCIIDFSRHCQGLCGSTFRASFSARCTFLFSPGSLVRTSSGCITQV